MNARYSVGRADKEGQVAEPMFPSDELLRTLRDDREREVKDRIRVRQLTGPRHPTIRWRSGQPLVVRQAEKRTA